MCGRYVSRTDAAMEREWNLIRPPPLFESYNVAPSQAVPTVRAARSGAECVLLRWGLVPAWAKGIAPRYSTINARIETLTTAATWRDAWKNGRRCILPALGFYEWQQRAHRKQPYFIHLTGRTLFGLAGLWEQSTGPDGEVESVTIITMPANALLARIHNTKQRMPAILHAADHATWLHEGPEAAFACLEAYPENLMRAYPVSTRVNSPRHDGPELISPIDEVPQD